MHAATATFLRAFGEAGQPTRFTHYVRDRAQNFGAQDR
jgi:hypothetical protein